MRVDREKLAEAREEQDREEAREAVEPDEGYRLREQWLGLLLAPATFALQFQTAYLLVPWACLHGVRVWLHVVAVLSVALGVLGVLIARRVWARGGGGSPGEDFGLRARERFMGATGVFFSSVVVLIMLAQWANKLVSPCE